MFTALETQNVSHLLNACLRLVLMNTIRIAPTYLGALVIADRLTREGVSRFRGPRVVLFPVGTWSVGSVLSLWFPWCIW